MDAARQMLDELMGRNRNLHPKLIKKISWDDESQGFCQYYIVKFCPHDLFVNTRADLGPCFRIHDEEAKKQFEDAHPSLRKRNYEDEFLRFCLQMLNDVDRKIQKGKQRLQLMRKDQQTASSHLSKYQEQITNIDARINKLVSEAEEAGKRGDVDQARGLMILCDQLREERGTLATHRRQINGVSFIENSFVQLDECSTQEALVPPTISSPKLTSNENENSLENDISGESKAANEDRPLEAKPSNPWSQDANTAEKQMEVCEICGAFLIVGDAQQRISDHLMGKQHVGYSMLRSAVAEIYERRQKEREDEDRKRRENRRSKNAAGSGRRGDADEVYERRQKERDRERGRDRECSQDHSADRYRRRHSSKSYHRNSSSGRHRSRSRH